MSRKPMVAGNWKMHKTAGEAVVLAQKLEFIAEDHENKVEVVVAPPFTALHSVSNVIELDRVPMGLAAQNMFWEDEGAYTGEISPRMLEDLRVDYVIVGHSERRVIFNETDAIVNRKLKAVFEHGMTGILCCGETLVLREDDKTVEFISNQIAEAVQGLSPAHVRRLVVAYEPIWAIGTGRTATPEMAQEVCAAIRSVLAHEFNQAIADDVRVLYGGSVKPENAAFFFAQNDIDGALVGGASLAADAFGDIIKAAAR